MLLDYQDMLSYVERILKENKGIKSNKPQLGFRNRFEHIKRVYGWVQRIIPGVETCNKDAVYTAAIFHDCGYRKDQITPHEVLGAKLFEDYALEHQLDPEFTKLVSYLIREHSHKDKMHMSDTPIELVLLMEADLMDEEGALGLVFDLLAEGYKGPKSYNSVFNEIMIHSVHILDQNYMVTPLAIKFWNDKKELIKRFITDLKFDLFMEQNDED